MGCGATRMKSFNNTGQRNLALARPNDNHLKNFGQNNKYIPLGNNNNNNIHQQPIIQIKHTKNLLILYTENSNQKHIKDENLPIWVSEDELKNAHSIVEKIGNKLGYEDPDFPPKQYSLSTNPDTISKFQEYEWMRAGELFDDIDYCLFNAQIKPNDIIQGDLDDCYLLSALISLAERKNLIMKLFPDLDQSSDEINCMWLNDAGEWKIIIVDDFIPVLKKKDLKNTKSTFAFSRSKSNELWVTLVEKAYAKMYKSYEKIEYGYSSHAFRDLTGAPYIYYSINNASDCWEFLSHLNFLQYFITANSKEVDESKVGNKIPSRHSFAILGLKEVNTPNGNFKLIRMRNPWGVSTWSNDLGITADFGIKNTETNYKDNDGIFYIPIEDFVKYFGTGSVCKYNPNYEYTYIKLVQNTEQNYSIVCMNLKKPSHLYVSISQKDLRHFTPKSYNYSQFKLMIVKLDDNFEPSTFAIGDYNRDRDCNIEANFEIGDYLIYIEFDWCQDFWKEFVLSTYGNIKPDLIEVIYEKPKYNIVETLINCNFNTLNDPTCKINYENHGEPLITRSIKFICGYLAILYQNNSNTSILEEKFTMNELEHLKIWDNQFNDDNNFCVHIPSKSKKLILYYTDVNGYGSYRYKYQFWSLILQEHDNDTMKKIVKEKAQKSQQRSLKGQLYDVFVHNYSSQGGVCLLYENKCEFKYCETLKLKIENLAFEHEIEDNTIYILLKPGEDILLKFKVLDITKSYSFETKASIKFYKEKS